MKFKYPVVCITWIDSTGYTGWHPVANIREPLVITSVGFLIKTNKTTTEISLSIDNNSVLSVGDVLVIPSKIIKSIDILRKGTKQ